jgi:hypothetical protein
MNRKMLPALALSLIASASFASAGVITFDDLPSLAEGGQPISGIGNGYAGFNWGNFSYIDTAVYDSLYAPTGSGYFNGTVSSPNVGENDPFPNFQGAAAVSTGTISSATAFNLVSAEVTAGWYDGLSLEVQGFNGATLEDDHTYTVNTESPSLINFNYDNITSVDFISSGGTTLVYAVGAGFHTIAVDNLTVAAVPEPASIGCLLIGASVLGNSRRWRRSPR